jgi:acyl-CoA synthetase (AMP-forming)/AMP-acid ligase II
MAPSADARPTPRLEGLLSSAAETYGDRTAIVHGDTSIAYAELADRVAALADRIAGVHAGMPFPPGARIAVIAPNTPALVVGLFACWRLGAVAVPLNARLREHELRQTLPDAEPVVVVSVGSHLGYSFRDLLDQLLPSLPSVCSCLIVDPRGEVEEELEGPGLTKPAGLEAAFAALLYTSGTTGIPKGALVGHQAAAEGAPHLARIVGLQPDDRTAFVIPVSHAFGLACLLANVATGAAAVLVDSSFSPRPFLDALDDNRATVLHGSPSVFTSLLKARPEGVTGLRTGYVGGAAASSELFEQLDSLGTRLLNLYGLTETGAVLSCRHDDPPEIRHRTAGEPLPGIEVELAEADGQDYGELLVRGAAVTPGYYNRPAETAASFLDGWFHTGDLATVESGRVRIAGRAKELVHVGGFNVFPAEVEGVLLTHPDVMQAVVVGVPHPAMGEALHAFVVPREDSTPTSAALLRFARDKIAGYKLPYAIEICPELPALASGKPDRRALADAVAPAASLRGEAR